MTRKKFDDEDYVEPAVERATLYKIDGEELTFEQIKRHCPHVSEKMLRDRLWRGETKMSRLQRPPDNRPGRKVDKPKSWR